MIRLAILLFIATTSPSPTYTKDAANSFAISYNTWLELHKLADSNTVNAKEIQAWQATRQAWKQLDKTIHY